MQPTSVQAIAVAKPMARRPLRLAFGFPRAWLARQLRCRVTQQLYIGIDACTLGYRHDSGRFIAVGDDDDFDGPDFVLRLSYSLGGHAIFDHDIELRIGILHGCYQLHTGDRNFDIAFLPTADTVQLAHAVQWIIGGLDKLAQARRAD